MPDPRGLPLGNPGTTAPYRFCRWQEATLPTEGVTGGAILTAVANTYPVVGASLPTGRIDTGRLVQVMAAETVALGAMVASDVNGKAVNTTRADVVGVALSGGGAGEIIWVRLDLPYEPPVPVAPVVTVTPDGLIVTANTATYSGLNASPLGGSTSEHGILSVQRIGTAAIAAGPALLTMTKNGGGSWTRTLRSIVINQVDNFGHLDPYVSAFDNTSITIGVRNTQSPGGTNSPAYQFAFMAAWS